MGEPPAELPNETADKRATTAGKNRPNPAQSNGTRPPVSAAGDEEPPGQRPEQAEGDVDQEDEAPAAGGEQEPTDARPQGQADGLGGALDSDGPPERAAGTARTMMATLLACSMAAPSAWTARKAISAPRSGANPHSADPTMKMNP